MTLRVNLEDLICSAVHTGGQCEDLATGYLASGNRIEAAQSGWVDSSAAAINAKLAAWQQVSQSVLDSLGEHVRGLHDAAYLFAATERARAQTYPGEQPC